MCQAPGHQVSTKKSQLSTPLISSPTYYRMNLVSLRRPYQIFSDPLPPPPPLLHAQSLPNQTCTSFMPNWINARFEPEMHYSSISAALDSLGSALRLCSRRKLLWPVEETISPQSCPRDYLEAVLKPIVKIFDQLHTPEGNILMTPMEVLPLKIDLEDPVCAFTYRAEDFASLEASPPVVLFVPGDLFTPDGTVTLGTKDALSEVLKHVPKVYSIVVTNLAEIAVFTPPRARRSRYEFERLETTQFTLALRAISTASLFSFAPRQFIQHPDIDVFKPIREGPPQNPDQPILSDQEVFESCRRLADFDLVTLPHYPARAYQFFRWCKYVKQNKAPITQSGDVLNAATNNTGTFFPENSYPVFPFDLSELPMDTSAHLKAIHRESPLATADIGRRVEESKNFTIQILETISENSAYGMSSVYLCQITSIDGQSVSSPTLCLKLFDDRFQELDIPDDDDPDYYLEYFVHLDDAPSLALNEAQIYDKLRPVQGSVIPWFYGVHQFTLPDGLILPGLIMEYIRGSRLNSDYVTTSSVERQVQMIRSCRHACRVLDAADVSQHDWHSGQMLIHTNDKIKFDHAVFIDFAFAVQTWQLEHMYIIKNYSDLFRILNRPSGMDGKLVDEHFGVPDNYDISEVYNEGLETNMFPYISLCEVP